MYHLGLTAESSIFIFRTTRASSGVQKWTTPSAITIISTIHPIMRLKYNMYLKTYVIKHWIPDQPVINNLVRSIRNVLILIESKMILWVKECLITMNKNWTKDKRLFREGNIPRLYNLTKYGRMIAESCSVL
jgi:hypothetical protein